MSKSNGEREIFPTVAVASIWCCWLFLVLPRMIVPPLIPLIEKDLTISHGDAALLMSAYMLSYALMQIPAGSLSDRLGKKYFIILSIFGTCFATVLMALTSAFSHLLILRVIAGLAAGLFFAPSTAYIVQFTTSKNMGMALGLVFTGGSFSSILISILINFFPVGELGWRTFFPICAIPGLLFAPLLFFIIKDKKKESMSHTDLDPKNLRQGLNTQVIILFIFNFVSSLSAWSLMTFIPTFFVEERGFTVAEAALLMLVNYITAIGSGPLSGIIARKTGFKVPGVIAVIAMCLVSFLLPLSYGLAQIFLVLSLWGLLGGLSWAPYNALLSEAVPKNLRGTFLGIFNLIGFLSGTVGPRIFGNIIDIAGFSAFFTTALLLNILSVGLALLILKQKSKSETQCQI